MDLEILIKKYALKNAIDHNGKASWKHVLSKILAEKKELKSKIKEIIPIVQKIVEDVNKLNLKEQKEELYKLDPSLLEKKKEKEDIKLDPLPYAEEGKVVLRFAPNPDGALHLGNVRAAILNDEYAKRYKGKFILRFEDTDPKNKKPLREAYQWILEDLEWLGVKIDEIYYQSKRLPIYYKLIKKLLEKGYAYVCLCSQEKIREYRLKGIECEHRNQPIEKNLELFDKILENYFREGEAVIRIKTDMKHKNPSVRDWIAFRIIDNPNHPIVGNKYILWPTYNFANPVDDHLMGVTHVIRMQEHSVNELKQEYIFRYFGWKKPIYIQYGALIIEGLPFHKSEIKKGIKEGKYKGWDDYRLATIRALRVRGISPNAIRKYIISVGLKGVSIKVNWGLIYGFIKEEKDREIPRYMFVSNPKKLVLNVEEPKVLKIPKHPKNEDLGYKYYSILPGENVFWIDEEDFNNIREGDIVRLLEFANVRIIKKEENIVYGEIIENQDLKLAKYKIQWVLDRFKVNVEILKLDGKKLEGFGEYILKYEENSLVQFVRKMYANLYEKYRDKLIFVESFR